MTDITKIRYRDIAQAETAERSRLKARLAHLTNLQAKGRTITSDEMKEIERIEAVLNVMAADSSEVCERLYVGVRDLFNATPGLLGDHLSNHDDGVLKGRHAGQDVLTDKASCTAALTIGLLSIDDALSESPIVIAIKLEDNQEAAKKEKANLDAKATDLKAKIDVLKANAARRTDAAAKHKALAESLNGEVAKLRAIKSRSEDENKLLEKKEQEAKQIMDDADADGKEAAAWDEQARALGDDVVKLEDESAAIIVHLPLPERRTIIADKTGSKWASLSRMFFAALGEAQSMDSLAMLVLRLLANEGDPRGRSDPFPGTVDAAEFARVMRKLTKDGTTVKEPQLRRRVNEALNTVQNRLSDGTSTELGINLPDLEDVAEFGIVPDNVKLMGPMICSAMFDELKVFEVVDKLVELFQQGMLTIANGNAGKQMYKYWKDAPNRMSDGERRNFYAMTMGIPGGEASGMVNREFNDLWLRFVSSVSSFVRQHEVDKLLRATLPSPISHQQIRKAARDLAVNLSLHGYGMAYHAALDIQAQIRFMIDLLGDKEVMANYGARDMWQVVDQVATLELGGAKSSSRYRTLATCGVIITAWLAKNAEKIRRANGPIIDIEEVRQPTTRMEGTKATSDPTDADLVNACLLWLADTATGDTVIEQMAQPRESPVMTSRPVQIPAIAREMLADLPVAGLSYGNTQH